jgi:ribonuclease E
LAHVPGEAVYGANGEAVPISLVSTTPQREYRSRTHADGTPERRSLSRSTTPRRNDRNASDSSQPAAAIWEGFDAEGVENDENFDLVNHPSYQDRDGANKKRRRRLGRTDQSETVRAVPRPTPNNEIRPGRGVAPPEPRNLNREPAPANISATNRPSAPSTSNAMRPDLGRNFVPTQIEAYVPDEPISLPVVAAEEIEEDRPQKPQRVKPTRPTIEPPEIIAVEMSELEKETYAWMGVSPLVKLGRELKNPKTAVVSVVPIGSLPPEELLPPLPPVEEVAEIVAVEPEPTIEPEQIELTLEPEPSDFVLPVPAEVLIPVVTAEIETVEVVETAPEVSMTEEESDELSANRRRKRRSSAIVD